MAARAACLKMGVMEEMATRPVVLDIDFLLILFLTRFFLIYNTEDKKKKTLENVIHPILFSLMQKV